MEISTKNQPVWYSLSHHDRYRKLNIVRRRWCRHYNRENTNQSHRTVHLEGTWINDVPSFYLSLGEAINGPNGYFGGCLDTLSDCLCGGFGISPPLNIRLRHFDEVRQALDGRAWYRFQAESFFEAVGDGEDNQQLVDWGNIEDTSEENFDHWVEKYKAALAGEAGDWDRYGSYFDRILEVLMSGGADMVPDMETSRV